jgi:hypothetical protein
MLKFNADALYHAFYDIEGISPINEYCGYYQFCQEWCENERCIFVTVWDGDELVARIRNTDIAMRDNSSYAIVYDEAEELTYVFFADKKYFTASLGYISRIDLIYVSKLQLFVKRQRLPDKTYVCQYTTMSKSGQVVDCAVLHG